METLCFDTLPLSVDILNGVMELGYTEMTPIQATAIPLILEGRDVVGRSSTGTGKTAAFGVPIVEKLTPAKPNHPKALVLAPTRELALQISEEMRKFGKYKKSVHVTTIYGGDSYTAQMAGLRTANLVVGTPGRVMDHMERGTLILDEVEIAVLDEADEMMDMGFIDDIRTILGQTPENRQTLLFSATMPPEILSLTRDFQRDPEMLAVDGGQRTLDTIEQLYYHVPPEEKMAACNLLIQRFGGGRALVFCNTRKMVDDLTEYLTEAGFSVTGLHGEMTQGQRTKVMSDFKMGRISVLVATDVAARGIDVEDVKAVINYDIPEDNEYYIHRIGRTGRAGKAGVSHTIACSAMHIRRIKELEKYIRMPIKRAYMPKHEDLEEQHREALKEQILKERYRRENDNWLPLVQELLESGISAEDLCATLCRMAAGESAMAIPEVTDIMPMLKKAEQRRNEKGGKKPHRELGEDRVPLKCTIGRNQKVAPNFIVSAIVGESGAAASTIGKIDIYNDYTVVEVTPETAKKILQTMQMTKIKGFRVKFSLFTGAPKKGMLRKDRPKRKY